MLKVERRFLCARPIAAFLSPIYLTYCNEMESIALFLTEMSLMQAAALIIASLASLYWVFRRRPELPPGPCSLFNMNPLGMLLHFASEKNAGKNHELFHSWNTRYGKIVNFRVFGLQFYLISDPALVSQVYSHSYSSVFTTRGKNGIKYFIPKSLLGLEQTDAEWKRHRSVIVGAFSESYLKKYFSTIVSVGKRLCNCLEASSTSTTTVKGLTLGEPASYECVKDSHTGKILVPNIVEMFNKLTYEVLANTVLGSEWMSVMTSFGSKDEMDAALATANFLAPLPEFLWKIVPFRQREVGFAAFSRVRRCALEQIAEIRRTGAKGDSMMHFLVHHAHGLEDNEIVDELVSLVMAGHETTANTLSFSLVSLAYDPKLQEKARQEVREAMKDCEDGEFTYDILKRIPFMWQIFREALRLFPTVPVNARMVDKDTKLGKYELPKGSRVLVNNYTLCRSAEHFENPLLFWPERWDNTSGISTEKHLANLKAFNDTKNFGGGQRLCVGKRFAEEEYVILLAILISRFSFSVPHEFAHIPLVEIPTVAQVTMTFEKPFPLHFKPVD